MIEKRAPPVPWPRSYSEQTGILLQTNGDFRGFRDVRNVKRVSTPNKKDCFLFDFGLFGGKFWVLFGESHPGFVRFLGLVWCKISVLFGDISTPNKTYSVFPNKT